MIMHEFSPIDLEMDKESKRDCEVNPEGSSLLEDFEIDIGTDELIGEYDDSVFSSGKFVCLINDIRLKWSYRVT